MNAAQQLSQWIEETHPDFFQVLYGHVARQRSAAQARRSYLRGFGDDAPVDTGSFDVGYDTNTVASQYTPEMVDIPTLDASSLTTPELSQALQPDTSNTLDVATDNSGSGFLQSIGAGITNAASSVGNFLTSSQGLSDVAKLANSYFQLQNNKVNAQVQTNMLQAQIARTTAGQSPYPVTYARSANGTLVPVIASSGMATLPAVLQSAIASGGSQYVTTPSGVTGYTIPHNVVSSLGSNISLSQMLPWALALAAAVILAKELGK